MMDKNMLSMSVQDAVLPTFHRIKPFMTQAHLASPWWSKFSISARTEVDIYQTCLESALLEL